MKNNGKNRQLKVFLVPSTHSDLQYLKPYREYLPIHLANLKAGIDLLEKYPEYCYVTEHIPVLEEFWARFPGYRSKLRRFVRERRLEISPNFYCICDLNIPCGESLIRQIYYGHQWTRKHLGFSGKTAWIADSFGLNFQLPQILKKSGYQLCLFSRGIDDPDSRNNFVWRGLDGSEISTTWLIAGYGGIGAFTEDKNTNFARIRGWVNVLGEHADGQPVILGNGGDFTMPSKYSSERVREWNEGNEEKLVFGTTSKYLEAVAPESFKRQVVNQEFNPVFKGTYSSRIWIKQQNRLLENRILVLERLAALDFFPGNCYPQIVFDKIWCKLLFFQFHDTLCGTISDLAFKEVKTGYRRIAKTLDELEKKLKPDSGEKRKQSNLCIFNPFSWRVETVVKLRLPNGLRPEVNGETVPCQKVTEDGEELLLINAGLPPLGERNFKLGNRKATSAHLSAFKLKGREIETPFYRLKLAPGSAISSLVAKSDGFEFVNQDRPYFNNLILQDDNGDLWLLYEGPLVDSLGPGAGRDNWFDPIPETARKYRSGRREVGFCLQSKDCPATVTVMEKGPLRFTVRCEGSLNFWNIKVNFTQDIRLYAHSGRIDFRTEILPFGRNFRLRAFFPTVFKKSRIYHEIPFGALRRPEGEYPAQNWMAYGTKNRGLVLFNQGIPGNNVTENTMMLSLFRSTAIEYKCPSVTAYGEGILHIFHYALMPYDRLDFSAFSREGMLFNMPVPAWTTASGKPGGKNCSAGFLLIEPENLILSGLYRTEKGIILRMYEACGRHTSGRIRFTGNWKPDHVLETDILGNSQGRVPLYGAEFKVNANRFEIKTYFLGLPTLP